MAMALSGIHSSGSPGVETPVPRGCFEGGEAVHGPLLRLLAAQRCEVVVVDEEGVDDEQCELYCKAAEPARKAVDFRGTPRRSPSAGDLGEGLLAD